MSLFRFAGLDPVPRYDQRKSEAGADFKKSGEVRERLGRNDDSCDEKDKPSQSDLEAVTFL